MNHAPFLSDIFAPVSSMAAAVRYKGQRLNLMSLFGRFPAVHGEEVERKNSVDRPLPGERT